jgi:acyl carrier protein
MQAVHHTTIQSWLTTRLAEQLGLASEAIDVQKPFAEYGLDSMVGVFLAGDLEEWLGLKLSPTVLWEYPTTEALAHYLATELWRQGTNPEDAQPVAEPDLRALDLDPEEAEALLARLDSLSNEEIDQLLSELCAARSLAA